ncbi:hypothetical protein B7C51_20465 [Paenibacillus larvae subsp. pulvifaciens]|uniref:Uncharacterized protein n=1 Tax=Paenibacillus larvae subsp. pulvifaciens TaxID=1477 RepID=A0A1V0UNJ5_9BACL|nr:hypothetical protein [Paenibacillus larvae]ARF66666.1 hypothetical protein B7C51_00885 [Paenibacillus larvae subsp. pulvifaciens]ARF67033.1 hypothetical protein B7C51_03230 [Paenibacillus larvae subsp. pulvifaciens]ARF69523.1 hypothetical protein B7C51_19420 [Paenibacillus larvae subsp. pulvifaciens]ARF69700.1 hypothetical protein B7C51_20465 [Paenibacillus larvae subsp. pulvifaciens]
MSKTKQAIKPAVFSKEQFLESKQFTTMQKHILSVVLKEGETYTFKQAKQLVEDLLNREVR